MSSRNLFILLVVLQRHAFTAIILQVVAGGDLQTDNHVYYYSELNYSSVCGCVCLCATLYQSISVVAHVPEGDEGQSDPAAVLSRDLVLTGHHRGHGPPVTRMNQSQKTHERWLRQVSRLNVNMSKKFATDKEGVMGDGEQMRLQVWYRAFKL